MFEDKSIVCTKEEYYGVVFFEDGNGYSHFQYAGGYAHEVYSFWVPNKTWGMSYALDYQVHSFCYEDATNGQTDNLLITKYLLYDLTHNTAGCCETVS